MRGGSGRDSFGARGRGGAPLRHPNKGYEYHWPVAVARGNHSLIQQQQIPRNRRVVGSGSGRLCPCGGGDGDCCALICRIIQGARWVSGMQCVTATASEKSIGFCLQPALPPHALVPAPALHCAAHHLYGLERGSGKGAVRVGAGVGA